MPTLSPWFQKGLSPHPALQVKGTSTRGSRRAPQGRESKSTKSIHRSSSHSPKKQVQKSCSLGPRSESEEEGSGTGAKGRGFRNKKFRSRIGHVLRFYFEIGFFLVFFGDHLNKIKHVPTYTYNISNICYLNYAAWSGIHFFQHSFVHSCLSLIWEWIKIFTENRNFACIQLTFSAYRTEPTATPSARFERALKCWSRNNIRILDLLFICA